MKENETVPLLPAGFKVMFAGNLGEAQNLENVLAASKILKDRKDIHWIFLGEGRKRQWMERFVQDNEMGDTVHILGRFPIGMMPSFFKQANVMLVALGDSVCFNLTLPAKVQAYMSCSKPILGFMKGEGDAIIKDADCGICVDANDVEAFSNAVLRLAEMTEERLAELGRNGYDYYCRNFNRKKLIDRLEAKLTSIVMPKGGK